MKSYFCALIPDNKANSLIQNLKDESSSMVGWQQFIKHFPHLTLFVGDYKKLDTLSIPDDLLKEIKDLKLSAKEWNTFLKDPVTGKLTLSICLEEESNKKIRYIQRKILDLCAKYNTGKIVDRYKSQIENFPKLLKDNTQKYGYPFIGDIWKGHFTIASFDKENYEKVWNKLKNEKVSFNFKINKLVFYSDDDKDNLILIKEFELN